MYPQLYIKRRALRLKQKDVAKKIGIHHITYSQKESGKSDFTLREAIMLTKVFNCSLDELFID